MRVAIVGPCASGKSTLAEGLAARGIDAYAVGQEHSIIANLWSRRGPDRLILLDVSLDRLRARRASPTWPCWIYELQLERLSDARTHADLVVDTSAIAREAVVERVAEYLARCAK